MRLLCPEEIKQLSFPDYKIIDSSLSFLTKELKITIEGAWLDTGLGYDLGYGRIVFWDWETLLVRVYMEKEWKSIEVHQQIYLLKDICEFTYQGDNLVLRGFGRDSGLWTEFLLTKSKSKFEFEFPEEYS